MRTRTTLRSLVRMAWTLTLTSQDTPTNPSPNLMTKRSKNLEVTTIVVVTIVVGAEVTAVVIVAAIAVAEVDTTTSAETATMITTMKTEEVVPIPQEARADPDVTKILKNKKIKMSSRKRPSLSRRG